jgi:hypothetical protein
MLELVRAEIAASKADSPRRNSPRPSSRRTPGAQNWPFGARSELSQGTREARRVGDLKLLELATDIPVRHAMRPWER